MFNKCKNLLICGAVMAAVLTGCSNIDFGNATVGSKSNEKCQLEISLGSVASRQILPTEFTKEDLKAFKISGESSRGEVLEETAISFNSEGKGTVNLSYAPWFLTLKAYSDKDAAKLVLEGSNFVDLSKGSASISFDLSSEDITTAGTVSLSGTYGDAESLVTKYTIGLYDFDTGALVGELTEDKDAADIEAKKFAFSAENVNPGNYIYGITFYGADGDGYRKIGYYSDLVRVNPGASSDGTDIVVPDVILKKPAAPENLTAYEVTGTEKSGWYTVRLSWDDKSTNEENFVINIYEYSEAGADKTGTLVQTLGVEDDASENKSKFLESVYKVSGNLNAGSTTCDIRLKSGALYDVTVQSQNFAGISSECSRTATETTGTSLTGYDIANRINLVKFVYTLGANSTLKTSSTVTHSGTTYTEYKFYKGTALTAMEIKAAAAEGETQTYPTLVKDGHEFTKWIDDSTGAEFTSTTWKNVSLTANYNIDYEVTYNLPESYQSLASTRVTATYTLSGTADTSFIGGTVNAGSSNTSGKNQPLTFTVTEPLTADTATAAEKLEFDEYKVIVDGNIAYSGEDNSYTMKSSEVALLDSGIHTVSVCARKADTTDEWYAYSFIFTMSR